MRCRHSPPLHHLPPCDAGAPYFWHEILSEWRKRFRSIIFVMNIWPIVVVGTYLATAVIVATLVVRSHAVQHKVDHLPR